MSTASGWEMDEDYANWGKYGTVDPTARAVTVLEAHKAQDCTDRDHCWARDIHDRFMDRPSPKMLRECANILETDPYRRVAEAAWLRVIARQDDDARTGE